MFLDGHFCIEPIQEEHRYKIMQWRNEQLYHLRQTKPLTEKDQDNYFHNVIEPQFNQDTPEQVLFSFLHDNECIGYGGLVHIDWQDKNAEISFVMDTKLENNYFGDLWRSFLKLIDMVAFDDLRLINYGPLLTIFVLSYIQY